MRDNTVNILIGGEAAQGLVTVGQLLAKRLVRSSYSIVVTQSYQSRIRGGHNTFAIRVGVDEVIAPKESVDFLVALDVETATLHGKGLSSDGLIVLDGALDIGGDCLLKVPFRVGTSRGGFALMVEGVSLASITETPVVIVVAQRPGPAHCCLCLNRCWLG